MPAMNRRFLQQVLIFALCHYFMVFALEGIIFHMRRLWPGETTPVGFNYFLAIMNCLIRGFLLATLKAVWASVRK
ncbi:MAG: hypothetical protein JWQ04_1459 [Pedosphaera sp.]|nr:hypothetical protein [Pedosphaera sp.]